MGRQFALWLTLLAAGIAAAALAQAVPPAGSSDVGPATAHLLGLAVVVVLAARSVQRVAALDGRRWYGTATAALFGL